MYAALWRLLPGGRALKALQMLVLAAAFVAVLFAWVFPAVTPHLPFENVTIDAPTDAPSGAPT